MDEVTTVYRSKVDFWLAALVFGITLMALVPCLIADFSVIFFLIGIIILAVEVALLNYSYIISGHHLIVQKFFFSRTYYAIDTIVKVIPSNNMLRAPAASFDRIEITFSDGDTLIISPRFKKEFVAQLLRINPSIEVAPELKES